MGHFLAGSGVVKTPRDSAHRGYQHAISLIIQIGLALFLVLASSPAIAAQPSIPESPKSESDCMAWSKTFNSYWQHTLNWARGFDARCKANYKGSYKTIQQGCVNTSGEVTVQNPCDQTTYYAQCMSLAFDKTMRECLNRVAKHQETLKQKPPADETVSPSDDDSATQEYSLDADDVAFLKQLEKDDEFVRKLYQSSLGIQLFAKLLDRGAVGPAKLATKWNRFLIKEFVEANKRVGYLEKAKTCQGIVIQSGYSKEPHFFDELYKIRGCDDY